MTDKNVRFVDMANPHRWLLTADSLHMRVMTLAGTSGRSAMTLRDHKDGTQQRWDGVNRGMFLLGGFALENAIKAKRSPSGTAIAGCSRSSKTASRASRAIP